MTPRPLRLLLALAPAALLLTAPWSEPAVAGCVAPPIAVVGQDVARPVLTRGEPVTVTGAGFLEGCDDTGSETTGGCEDDPEATPPYTDVVLAVHQGKRAWSLATADADEAGDIVWEGTLPDELRPGRAVLRSQVGEPLVIRVG